MVKESLEPQEPAEATELDREVRLLYHFANDPSNGDTSMIEQNTKMWAMTSSFGDQGLIPSPSDTDRNGVKNAKVGATRATRVRRPAYTGVIGGELRVLRSRPGGKSNSGR